MSLVSGERRRVLMLFCVVVVIFLSGCAGNSGVERSDNVLISESSPEIRYESEVSVDPVVMDPNEDAVLIIRMANLQMNNSMEFTVSVNAPENIVLSELNGTRIGSEYNKKFTIEPGTEDRRSFLIAGNTTGEFLINAEVVIRVEPNVETRSVGTAELQIVNPPPEGKDGIPRFLVSIPLIIIIILVLTDFSNSTSEIINGIIRNSAIGITIIFSVTELFWMYFRFIHDTVLILLYLLAFFVLTTVIVYYDEDLTDRLDTLCRLVQNSIRGYM